MLQVEHAQPRAEIRERAAAEVSEIMCNPASLVTYIEKHLALSKHWGVRKNIDVLLRDFHKEYGTREARSKYKDSGYANEKDRSLYFTFFLWSIEEDPTEVVEFIKAHALFSEGADSQYTCTLHKSYSSFLFEDESNKWLLDAHGNLQKSGKRFMGWLAEMILNQQSDLSRKHAEVLLDYLFYYISLARGCKMDQEAFKRDLMEDLARNIDDYSKAAIFQEVFIIEGSMLRIGESNMGLGDSLQHFYLRQKAPLIRISQFLHQHNEALAKLVEITIDDLEKGKYSRDNRLKIQRIFLWLLSSIHEEHVRLITEFIDQVSKISKVLARKLDRSVSKKKTTVMSPGTGHQRDGDLLSALRLVLEEI